MDLTVLNNLSGLLVSGITLILLIVNALKKSSIIRAYGLLAANISLIAYYFAMFYRATTKLRILDKNSNELTKEYVQQFCDLLISQKLYAILLLISLFLLIISFTFLLRAYKEKGSQEAYEQMQKFLQAYKKQDNGV